MCGRSDRRDWDLWFCYQPVCGTGMGMGVGMVGGWGWWVDSDRHGMGEQGGGKVGQVGFSHLTILLTTWLT